MTIFLLLFEIRVFVFWMVGEELLNLSTASRLKFTKCSNEKSCPTFTNHPLTFKGD